MSSALAYEDLVFTNRGYENAFLMFAARGKCPELKPISKGSRSLLYTPQGNTHMLVSAYTGSLGCDVCISKTTSCICFGLQVFRLASEILQHIELVN